MEELMKIIDEANDYLTPERLKSMTTEERSKYLQLVEELKARVDTIIDICEGGDE